MKKHELSKQIGGKMDSELDWKTNWFFPSDLEKGEEEALEFLDRLDELELDDLDSVESLDDILADLNYI